MALTGDIQTPDLLYIVLKGLILQLISFIVLGLVTLDQMKAKQEDVVKARERQLVVCQGEARLNLTETNIRKRRKDKVKQVL